MRLAVPCLLAILALAARAAMGATRVPVADIAARRAYDAARRLAEDGGCAGPRRPPRWGAAERASPQVAGRA